MKFDFERIIERHGTHSSKWDGMKKACGVDSPDAIAMWVADMDFPAPPATTRVLKEEVERAVHGYFDSNESWRRAQCDWLSRRHGWKPDPEWVSTTPGIVSALGLIIQAFSEEGDDVIVFSPAYHAFRRVIQANKRRIHNRPMLETQGRYKMDIEGLSRNMPERARIVFLCSPHNPGGTIWSLDELKQVADFCEAHDLILVADEIHCDLVYDDSPRFVPMALAVPEIMKRTIACVSATKSFNLAGAHVGAAITPNPELKKKLDERIAASGLDSYNLFGMIATEAALREGDEWLDALLPVLKANRDRFHAGIARAIPGARPMPLEATYLAWVDFAETGIQKDEYMKRIAQEARLGVSPGPIFGPGGESWVRFNLATQPRRIEEAISRLEDAFSDSR